MAILGATAARKKWQRVNASRVGSRSSLPQHQHHDRHRVSGSPSIMDLGEVTRELRTAGRVLARERVRTEATSFALDSLRKMAFPIYDSMQESGVEGRVSIQEDRRVGLHGRLRTVSIAGYA
ncbi:hypothetical protein DSL72_004431 [Monilinia vaccinii-corymbosi]|uniref:Uncharacterized protein n=1 Tax=Monilinia vaccinii-corymbosi TaxID=61207 RepID=A0A8A3NWM2_9HELO|nr:hypothetical protein DSL72_004431 [Monilinia vaccinii-corymbosi]